MGLKEAKMDCINYCNSCGNCSRCGGCCAGTLPLTRKEEKRIKEYIKLNRITPEAFVTNDNMNLLCCFYDRQNKRCKIYEVRPKICRTFKCNRKLEELEREKIENHKRAYWNKMSSPDDHPHNITDMRLLFYDDPRSLTTTILYGLTGGTMICTERDIDLMKTILRRGGQIELANCIHGEYEEVDNDNR